MADAAAEHGAGSPLIAVRAFKKGKTEQKIELPVTDKIYKKTFSYQISHRIVT